MNNLAGEGWYWLVMWKRSSLTAWEQPTAWEQLAAWEQPRRLEWSQSEHTKNS